jgi:glycosyltransferase involved in cell wall biosynthesis
MGSTFDSPSNVDPEGPSAKRVLMIAYHYPPCAGSSGIQRTLRFSQHLRRHGWKPIVLTVHPRAYPRTGTDQLEEIPDDVPVSRAFALDTARHLSFRRSYPATLALPDRWVTWWFGAVTTGLRLIQQYEPQAIWSTYPIATAHLIGLTLARLSGIDWIADFRDSMTEDDYPPDPTTRRVYRSIERRAIEHCRYAVFTTEGTRRMYAERYREAPSSRWKIISNGYDEDAFRSAESVPFDTTGPGTPLRLIHSGLLYPNERNPKPFFSALSKLRKSGRIQDSSLSVVLRASGNEVEYRRILRELDLEGIVSLEPIVPYKEALREMLSADGLLLFQASNCNHQIPAKVYEYLRARRPILALTDASGDTARVLTDAGLDSIVDLESSEDIARGLLRFIDEIREGRPAIAGDSVIESYSRARKATELAALLESVGA